MWIAKPLQSLSGAERAAWIALQERKNEIPLSQTLAWGEAIIALGGRAYLVFSPEEQVGGMVHSVQEGFECAFECINGPYLNWDDRANIARQFATFVMAVTRLGPPFSSLRVQPRWLLSELESRLKLLPVPPREVSQASTIHLPVQSCESERLASVTPRLRRSLSVAKRAQVQVRSFEADSKQVSEFAFGIRKFGQEKGFYVPDENWLQSLIKKEETVRRESLFFFITEAKTEGAMTSLLTCVHGSMAHYLFGYDERDDRARSSLSTSAAAHFHVLENCASRGVKTYDLNGYTDPTDFTHPYAGVSRFKAQFQGEIINYASPLFLIES